ncbi:MAG: esterase [Comamonadaceae bacterium]|nr:esterase [Comamonadaceae bacterium]
MTARDLIIQRPAVPRQLVLLFHGVGSSASDIAPLGRALAPHLPDALIVSAQAPEAVGRGWQWFSVQGVTEANRPARVATAMPGFVQAIEQWQREAGVGPAQTTLIGFSQGAIMALESTQLGDAPAGRVFALSGRFARPPRLAPVGLMTHLVHGDADAVMPIGAAVEALARLQSLGAVATLDRLPGLGHGIDARVVDAVVHRLTEPRDSPGLQLHIGDEQLLLSAPGLAEQRLDLGAARIARAFFRQDPPTPQDIEQAIDFTEDQLMRLGPRREAGPLWSPSARLQPWAAVAGPTLAVDTVEQWFERLALAAQGRSDALDGLPPGREAAATLLVLREFMHHRGHGRITVVGPKLAVVGGPASA